MVPDGQTLYHSLSFCRSQKFESAKKLHLAGAVLEGSAGIWTRDLAHPKRESYP